MESLTQFLDDPSMMHAIAVHMPIALAMLGVPLLAALLFIPRNLTLRIVAIVLYVVAAGSAYVAEETGENARSEVPNTYPLSVWDQIDAHAAMGERVPIAAAITAAILLLSLIKQETVQRTSVLIAMCAAVVTAGMVVVTGHQGGLLVYTVGVGTPDAPAQADLAEAQPIAAAPTPIETIDEAPEAIVEEPDVDVIFEEGAAADAPAPPEPEPESGLVAIKPIDMEAANALSYEKDIYPIMFEYCILCHEEPDPDGAYDMTTVAGIIAGGEKAQPAVIPGDPDNSPLVQYIRGALNPRMPHKEDPLTPGQLHPIRMWIAAGAKDN